MIAGFRICFVLFNIIRYWRLHTCLQFSTCFVEALQTICLPLEAVHQVVFLYRWLLAESDTDQSKYSFDKKPSLVLLIADVAVLPDLHPESLDMVNCRQDSGFDTVDFPVDCCNIVGRRRLSSFVADGCAKTLWPVFVTSLFPSAVPTEAQSVLRRYQATNDRNFIWSHVQGYFRHYTPPRNHAKRQLSINVLARNDSVVHLHVRVFANILRSSRTSSCYQADCQWVYVHSNSWLSKKVLSPNLL